MLNVSDMVGLVIGFVVGCGIFAIVAGISFLVFTKIYYIITGRFL